MSRCYCCDVVLLDRELRRTKSNGEPEDLCSECSFVVFLDLEELLNDREYAFENITENPLTLMGYSFGVESILDKY